LRAAPLKKQTFVFRIAHSASSSTANQQNEKGQKREMEDGKSFITLSL